MEGKIPDLYFPLLEVKMLTLFKGKISQSIKERKGFFPFSLPSSGNPWLLLDTVDGEKRAITKRNGPPVREGGAGQAPSAFRHSPSLSSFRNEGGKSKKEFNSFYFFPSYFSPSEQNPPSTF